MPVDDLDGPSRDLRELLKPDPAEAHLNPADRETRIQRFGRWNLRGGIAVMAGSLFAAVSLAVATNGPTFTNPVAQMWAVLSLVTVMTLGAVLIVVGSIERIQRPHRAMTRELIRQGKRDREQQTLMAAALDRIAQHLPEDQQIRHWRGYNAAVREGFAASTGTDSHLASQPSRGTHLGLVSRERKD